MSRLPPEPEIAWNAEGVPSALTFGDTYFSKAGGLAESEAVFLAGTGLPEGWRNRDRFALCELGFGTGLNVLAAWRAWKTTRLAHAQLHISTIEAFPLAKADAARALAAFPEISDLAAQLLARWPVRAYGPQRFWFPDDGLSLTIHVGGAETVLAGLDGRFDAWFLDGFAPARNPGMWTPNLFAHVARLSAPNARAATFTVAGDVRRGLEAAGFAVEKKPGFGSKRERLEATHPPPLAGEVDRAQRETEGRVQIYPYAPAKHTRVAVLGAGIAGAAAAQALTRRNIETIVFDAALDLGAGASGNPAGLVMPRLDRGGGAQSELFLAAYLHAIAAYETLGVFEACGVEQRAEEGDEALTDLLNDPPLPTDWFTRTPNGAAFHPRAGLVRPRAATKQMLCGSTLMLESPVRTLERADDGWILRAPDNRALLKADAVILACGAALTQFEAAQFLPITISHGQIEWGRGGAPTHAITQGSYVAPFDNGILFGATFDKTPADEAEARARNIAALTKLAPDLAASLDHSTLHSRRAERATTPDRLPIAGLLPDAPAWLAQYAALAHSGKIETQTPPPAHAGVYVIGGLGARGLTLAPLLGERIASEICNEPMPLSRAALDAIHPARFLHRSLKRR